MAITAVTTAKLNSAANNLEGLVQRYQNSVNKLYELGSSLDSMWDGEASNKFMATLGSDRESFNSLETMLRKYIEVLRQNADTYSRGENDVLQVLGTNKIR